MYYKFVTFVLLFAFYVKIFRCDTIDTYYNNNNNRDADHSTDRNHPSMLCMDIQPQHSLDIKYIMGLWYGSEIIMHSQDVPGVFSYDSCVVIHLTDITEQMQTTYNTQRRTNTHYYQDAPPTPQQHSTHNDYIPTKYLRLVWSEKDDNLEYTFNYTDNSPGLWTNIGEQRGSLVALNQYTQFTGTVQVVKAVNDHLVLTFCGSSLKSSIYTIVLSRKAHGLNAEELNSIRKLLWRRGLSTDTIRKVCTESSAASVTSSILFALTAILFVVTLKSY